MTLWEWWWLEYDGQEQEGWQPGGEDRAETIAMAQREVPRGGQFLIIEARSSSAACYEGADWVPFLRTRNREMLTNGPT